MRLAGALRVNVIIVNSEFLVKKLVRVASGWHWFIAHDLGSGRGRTWRKMASGLTPPEFTQMLCNFP
jgi:hypothetical protein